jgi:hypothetical protein
MERATLVRFARQPGLTGVVGAPSLLRAAAVRLARCARAVAVRWPRGPTRAVSTAELLRGGYRLTGVVDAAELRRALAARVDRRGGLTRVCCVVVGTGRGVGDCAGRH